MAKLKSRERFPPGGFQYYQPESQWRAPANSSFEQVVSSLIQHRKGNPHLVNTHGWSIDPETVRNEVDSFTARLCKQLGYMDYIYEGAPDPEPPKKAMPRPMLQSLAGAVAGAETLVEWISSGAEAVPRTVAEKRANICVVCPMNGKGDFSRYFTVPVSEAIRREIQRKNDMNLETHLDNGLNVCEACGCPLRLKIWVPIERIRSAMDDETKSRLHHSCWITHGP